MCRVGARSEWGAALRRRQRDHQPPVTQCVQQRLREIHAADSHFVPSTSAVAALPPGCTVVLMRSVFGMVKAPSYLVGVFGRLPNSLF